MHSCPAIGLRAVHLGNDGEKPRGSAVCGLRRATAVKASACLWQFLLLRRVSTSPAFSDGQSGIVDAIPFDVAVKQIDHAGWIALVIREDHALERARTGAV